MVGQEAVVGEPHQPGRPCERTAHGDLAVTPIPERRDEVAGVAEGMPLVEGERPLGGPFIGDQQTDAVLPPPRQSRNWPHAEGGRVWVSETRMEVR